MIFLPQKIRLTHWVVRSGEKVIGKNTTIFISSPKTHHLQEYVWVANLGIVLYPHVAHQYISEHLHLGARPNKS